MEPDSPRDFTEVAHDSSSPRRSLPADLPKTLDDRRISRFDPGEEFYDAWQGQAHYITPSAVSRPLDFGHSLGARPEDDAFSPPHRRAANPLFDRMLAAQAAYREDGDPADDDKVASDTQIADHEKSHILLKSLHAAASNNDPDRVDKLLDGPAKKYLDLNGPDEEGTAPLIYAACFGYTEIVSTLLDHGAKVNQQDTNQWTALMWATANRHADTVKMLLERGASPEMKSSSGRTAFDFVDRDSDIYEYLHENGYQIGSAGLGGDFYDAGYSHDKFEEDMAEREMKQRMMMESAVNLEVDIGNLSIEEHPEMPDELEEGNDFVWDRCLNDQMLVFQESELPAILDVVITHMQPQRSPAQKPVPANMLFLGARYAHYHASADLLAQLLSQALHKINEVVDRNQLDMTILAFWLSNCTLLLHYLKKDPGVMRATSEYQAQIAELINEIFVLIIRDAERRIDKVFDAALLEHETIPGLEVDFQNEWKIFKRKKHTVLDPPEKRFRPPSPRRRAKVAPRNVTSLLSSTLFVLDLYDVHSVITAQVLAQLLYWIGAELFNRIISNTKYLARTKAMQIRMNVSVIEEWARHNNRQPEHYENGSTTATGETTAEAARHNLAPVVQLLQWLQIFSALGENAESLDTTMQQLTRLSPQQLIHAVKHYRAEVGEPSLPKSAMKKLNDLQKGFAERKARRRSAFNPGNKEPETSAADSSNGDTAEDDIPEGLQMDPSLMLPFSLPTSTDMLVNYGAGKFLQCLRAFGAARLSIYDAGFGGVNRERERKYTPTVPPEFLEKLNLSGTKNDSIYEGHTFNETDEEDLQSPS